MASSSKSLRQLLRKAGISQPAIDAVWPEWWTDDAEGSPSATAELRYTVARRLGMSPTSLFDDSPHFIWKDETKYKSLSATDELEQAVLGSFGVALATPLIEATPAGAPPIDAPVENLRRAILESAEYVDLAQLLAMSWGIGIPVIYLTVWPLRRKRMQAMTVRIGDRYSILLAKESRYSAQVAFVLAHELGHVLRRHVVETVALLDMQNLAEMPEDPEEAEADAFALELLTGSSAPKFKWTIPNFKGIELASTVERVGQELRIHPATLALCVGYASKRWRQAMDAVKRLEAPSDLIKGINRIAEQQLRLDELPFETRAYLGRVLRGDDGD